MAEAGAVRIGVDGYNLAMPRGTGVATYGRTLAQAINGLGFGLDLVFGLNVPPEAPADLRESLFFARMGDDEARELPWTFRRMVRRAAMLPTARDLVEVPVDGRVIAEDFRARVPAFDRLFTRNGIFTIGARYFRRFGRFMPLRMPDPPAIMHWTYPLPLRLVGARNIYTLHDLVPLRLPHTSLEDKAYYHRLIRTCIETGDHIVTVSEASRDDINLLFPGHQDKVTNTYQAVERAERQDDALLATRLDRLFDLKKGEYFLFFGAIEPKKNVGRLLEAFLTAEIDRPLVVVGSEAWRSDRELRLLKDGHGGPLSAAGRIRRIDYLPRNLLMEVVQGARAVLFPSLYEGFGLPAAEAMAFEVPVLASNTGSLPEVVGAGGLTVDPYDVGALAVALRRLDESAALRSSLGRAGRDHVSRFSMERYQASLRDLYRRLAAVAPIQ